jgi:hypothetical protein
MTINKAIAAGALTTCLAAGLVVTAGAAQAQTLGQSIFQKLLGTSDDQPAINYSERAPLVIPPKRDLPAPGTAASADEDPNWPKDPDEIKRRKLKASADSVGPASSNSELMTGAPSMPTAGGIPGGKTPNQLNDEYEHQARPLSPTKLARRGTFGTPDEPLVAGQEPPRRSLIDPPTGLRTPLASAPLKGDEPLPSEVQAGEDKPWYEKIWRFGGGNPDK